MASKHDSHSQMAVAITMLSIAMTAFIIMMTGDSYSKVAVAMMIRTKEQQ